MAHQFACSACAFEVQSEDDDELIGIVRTHGEEKHDLDISKDDVRDGWEEVSIHADD
jgi:predicted small metal-binding protein